MFKSSWSAKFFAFTVVFVAVALPVRQAVVFGQSADKPNIILINLDDANAELLIGDVFEARYRNMARLANRGHQFGNAHATTPLCGPSRACLLRGQYAHNTGVFVNEPKAAIGNGLTGGMKYYQNRGYFRNDLSTWMQSAGYRTMMVGKFLHADFVAVVPPHWDDFYSYQGGKYYDYYRFSNRQPGGRWDQIKGNLYRSLSETRDVMNLLQTHVDRDNDQPFFLFLNPLGPHHPSSNRGMVDVARYENLWNNARIPYKPNFDERDFSDKRGDLGTLSRLNGGALDYVQNEYRDRLRATMSIDDQIGAIERKLEQLNLTDNTYIFVTSDNGFTLGHHRTLGKGFHYDRASRIPLFVAGPGISPGGRSDHLLAHIDITPTIVELAGGNIPGLVDGKSFAPLLKNPNSVRDEEWRSSILIENWESRLMFGQEVYSASNTLRRFSSAYTEHANGDREYYNLERDPNQIRNNYDYLSDASRMNLALQLRSLKTPARKPNVGYRVPSRNGQSFSSGVQLTGLVDDPFAVGAVRLSIQDRATSKYWNGSRWVNGFRQVQATLDDPEGTISHWRYAFEPSVEDVPEDLVLVWAWGYDDDGNWGAARHRSFRLNFDGPLSDIRLPRDNAQLTGPVTFQGTAFASSIASSVRFVLRRSSDRTFWNGTGFQSNWTFVSLPVDDLGAWKTQLDLPVGGYHAACYAVDSEGVVESKPQIVFFTSL